MSKEADQSDRYNLQRFVDAQNPIFDQVRSELRSGRKRSHWMWYIFPQIQGLGYSALSKWFAISSREEAQAYLNHPVLGPRLRKCTQLVIDAQGRSIEQILGSPDDIKFKSSMTLFANATTDNDLSGGYRYRELSDVTAITNSRFALVGATHPSHRRSDYRGRTAVSALSALTRPAPKSRSRPLGPRSLAVSIRIFRTSAGVSEGLRSINNAATPLTSAAATDVPVVS